MEWIIIGGERVEEVKNDVVELDDEKVVVDYTAEIGVTGLNRWGNDVSEEFLPQLRFPQAAKVYKEMSDNDPTIGAVLYMSEMLIRKAGWSVEPASDSPADMAAAKFLEECMNDMSYSWADTVTEILSMFTYGWSFHEVIYKVRGGDVKDPRYKSKYNDGRIGWRKMPVRAQSTLYGWMFDEDGGLLAMEQQAPPNYNTVTIPLAKGLLFRTKVVRDNPEGRSLLRNAYRPWYFKKRIEEIEGIGIERDLAGLPTLTTPQGVDIWNPQNLEAKRAKVAADTLVRNVRRDSNEGIVIPFGWEFKLLSTGGSRQFDTSAIINRYDQRIAVTMLADIVMMGADKVGSFALGEVKKSLLAASLEAQIQNIAGVFNSYAVPQLFRLNNFPGMTQPPQIIPGEVEVPDIKDLAFLLRASGLNVEKDYGLMSYLRRLASIPDITEKEFKHIYGTPETPEVKPEVKPVATEKPADGIESFLESSDELYAGK